MDGGFLWMDAEAASACRLIPRQRPAGGYGGGVVVLEVSER
jgi:hypothetical protein